MRNRVMVLILAMVAVLAFSCVALAQTAEQSGGEKAQTAAPAPDFSGVWRQHPPPGSRGYASYTFSKEIAPMTPWAEAKFKANKPSYGPRAVGDSNDPVNPTTGDAVGCAPPGVPRIYLHPFPMEIIQIPGRVIMLFEFDHFVRQIYTDGRGHNENLPPSWMGDSIGKWEGDTLVVDTTNFNDKTWLDRGGHPHSDQLHLVERIRRVDHDTLQIDMTFDDPKAYTKPWTGQQFFQLRPKWTLMELICEDNASFLELQKEVMAKPSN
ncbi:MAG: hypothetical protein WBC04_08650 [Candidatus Acidiferrales bacterium]